MGTHTDSKTLNKTRLVLALLVVGILAGLAGWAAYSVALSIATPGSGGLAAFMPSRTEGTPEPGQPPSADSLSNAAPAKAAALPTMEPWDGAGRVTLLLVGLDYRDWDSGEKYSRSDTMILLTLDPLAKTAGVLSIPRDMWVPIPGFKHGKINTAYYLGEAYNLPGGGPGLAIQTVEEFLGVPINYFAQIDFQTFEEFIDEIGGVRVDVPQKITIDRLGDGAKTIKKLRPGEHILTGPWALAYARARYTEGGDFDRAERQQQVLLGIREKVFSPEMLPLLVAKAPELYQELSSGIRTNLSLQDAIKLALLAQQIPQDKIQRGVVNDDYVLFGTSPDNLSILIPLPDKIQVLRDKIFATGSSLGPATPGDSQARMLSEAASVGILNGSSVPGMAERAANFLRAQGVNVTQVTESADQTASTYVVDHSGNPFILKFLLELLPLKAQRLYHLFEPSNPVEVEIIIGEDLATSGIIP